MYSWVDMREINNTHSPRRKHINYMHKKTEKEKTAPQNALTTEQFLSLYSNKKTKANYRLAIKHYLRITTGRAVSNKNLHSSCRYYLHELTEGNRNHYLDCKVFGKKLCENYSPTTANLYLRCACLWLEECGFPLNKRERQRLTAQLPPPKPNRCSIELKRKTFRTIYEVLPNDLRTLLLVLLASGMRIGETLQLKKTDIRWEEKRTEISIPAEITKTKTARTTYLTEEAAEALLDYLQMRKDNDERLFLITRESAQYHLRRAAVQLGFTQTINGRTQSIHWHMTRKWFISRFSLAANKDVAEHIAGHEGYLSVSYRRYTKKQILKEYIKAEKKLSILKEKE